jgi:hypothetical protein
MTKLMQRRSRRLPILILAGSLFVGTAGSVPVRAQPADPAAGEEGEDKGRPMDGYLLMVMLASLAFFIVGKSARR